MGFHPKNDLHKCKKVRLSIWTFWICFKNSVMSLKTDELYKLKMKCEKLTLKI